MVADFDRVLVFDRTRLVQDGSPEESMKIYRELMA
jgi:ABC-type multidrug transport system fused ATPase/permease subunit